MSEDEKLAQADNQNPVMGHDSPETRFSELDSADPGLMGEDDGEGRYKMQPGSFREPTPPPYQIPPGFKLIPTDYIAVEPEMYRVMVNSMRRSGGASSGTPSQIHVSMPEAAKEEPDQVFHVRMVQQMMFGDIGINLQRGEELVYCPDKKYIQLGGDRYTTLRSFLQMWNAQFGPRPDPGTVKNPLFQILNPQDCPPLNTSLGRFAPQRFRNDAQRIQSEERRGDATRRPVRVPGETAEYGLGINGPSNPVNPRDIDRDPEETLHPHRRPNANYAPSQSQMDHQQYRNHTAAIARGYNQGQQQYPYQDPGYYQQDQQARQPQFIQPMDPQAELNQMVNSRVPVMPPRAGVKGPDGLTQRGRMIKQMNGDQIERPVQRQQVQPIGGYEPPETVEGFQMEPGSMQGGQVVGYIPGKPADEAIGIAQDLDQQAARLANNRLGY
jgi:flagellum-specific peptidoglycan hydrolase FlgJ